MCEWESGSPILIRLYELKLDPFKDIRGALLPWYKAPYLKKKKKPTHLYTFLKTVGIFIYIIKVKIGEFQAIVGVNKREAVRTPGSPHSKEPKDDLTRSYS